MTVHVRMFGYRVSDSFFSVQHCDHLTGVRMNLLLRISCLVNRNLSTNSASSYYSKGWLCWGLTSQSTIFQSCRDGAIASWVINQYFRGVKCLAQGHNTAEVGLEPRTSRSGVRHSTTEPPRSPLFKRVQSFKLTSRGPLKHLCITNIIQIIQITGKVIHFLAKIIIWKSLNRLFEPLR